MAAEAQPDSSWRLACLQALMSFTGIVWSFMLLLAFVNASGDLGISRPLPQAEKLSDSVLQKGVASICVERARVTGLDDNWKPLLVQARPALGTQEFLSAFPADEPQLHEWQALVVNVSDAHATSRPPALPELPLLPGSRGFNSFNDYIPIFIIAMIVIIVMVAICGTFYLWHLLFVVLFVVLFLVLFIWYFSHAGTLATTGWTVGSEPSSCLDLNMDLFVDQNGHEESHEFVHIYVMAPRFHNPNLRLELGFNPFGWWRYTPQTLCTVFRVNMVENLGLPQILTPFFPPGEEVAISDEHTH